MFSSHDYTLKFSHVFLRFANFHSREILFSLIIQDVSSHEDSYKTSINVKRRYIAGERSRAVREDFAKFKTHLLYIIAATYITCSL